MDRAARCFPVVLAACLAAGGCSSTRLAYNNADWLLRREVSRHICPTEAQTTWLETQVEALHRWHRAQELPRYGQALRRLAGALDKPVSRQAVEALYGALDGARERLTGQVAGPLAEMLAGLSARQAGCLERQIGLWQDRVRKEVNLPGAVYVAGRREKLEESLEDWVGELTGEQRTALDHLLSSRQALHRAMAAAWQGWSLRLLALVSRAGTAPERREQLRLAFLERLSLYSEPERRSVMQWEQSGRQLTWEVARRLTAAQRARLRGRLLELAGDLQALSAPSNR